MFFVEVQLDIPRHPHPQFASRRMWSFSNAFTSDSEGRNIFKQQLIVHLIFSGAPHRADSYVKHDGPVGRCPFAKGRDCSPWESFCWLGADLLNAVGIWRTPNFTLHNVSEPERTQFNESPFFHS